MPNITAEISEDVISLRESREQRLPGILTERGAFHPQVPDRIGSKGYIAASSVRSGTTGQFFGGAGPGAGSFLSTAFPLAQRKYRTGYIRQPGSENPKRGNRCLKHPGV